MSKEFAKRWIALFVTRPMWGLIPVRLVFGAMLLFDSTPLHLLLGLLFLSGFLSRIAGLVLMAELTLSFFLPDLVIDFSPNTRFKILEFTVSAMIFISGSGRFSADRFLARKMLALAPSKKWERYLIAETPYCEKWYE